MNEFLQAELEAGQMEAAARREEPAEEPHQKRSRGTVAKHNRSQSTNTGWSAKRTRREPKAVLSMGTSTSGAEPEPSHADSEEDDTVQRLGRVGDESAESYPSRPAPRRV